MSSVPKHPERSAASLVDAFRKYLSRKNLKCTRQRDLIVEIFAGMAGHVSVEELWEKVSARNFSIGYATVYRTLKLLTDAGLADVRRFGDGKTRYEVQSEEHHDHLICLECGIVLEFHSERLEKLQEEVAQRHGFHIDSHRHELFGVCEAFLSGKSCPFQSDPSCLAQRVAPPLKSTYRGLMDEIPAPDEIPPAFRAYLSQHHLKSTRQRDLVVEMFAEMEGHVSVEDLLSVVKKRDPRISYATVYRTLKILVDGGFAVARSFGEGHRRFERRSVEHHDHMICQRSGTIIEFRDEDIESLQETIAHDLGFKLFRHRHELYGFLDERVVASKRNVSSGQGSDAREKHSARMVEQDDQEEGGK